MWYTFKTPLTVVPAKFYAAVAFNPHRTKGIYLGYDEDVETSHSYVGLPQHGFEKVERKYDWMVRVRIAGPDQVSTESGDEFAPLVDRAQQLVDLMDGGKFAKAVQLFDETMKRALPAEKLES